ncbi:MAG: YIP1 family protein, partial [bacterium]|nr:YIP1 family protein [Candidatus Kapabacteria bacterium]
MGLVDRAKNILLKPKEEWQVIAGETPDTGAMVTGYMLP